MRKIFLDCGANRGQSVARFRELFADHADYEIHCFEPHAKQAAEIDLGENSGTIHNVAVWVNDSLIRFYPGRSSLGSSLFPDKMTGYVSPGDWVMVPAIDFSAFLWDRCQNAYVVLKLNVEGAEYPVLEKMLHGTLGLVDRLFVCWHQHKIPSISEERHERLVDAIGKTGLACEDFWGRENGNG